MNKKWLIAGLVAVLVGGYAIYATFFLERVEVGELCKGSAMCEGECLGFGELLPDYSHREICTRTCASDADCNEATECRSVDVIATDGKGSTVANKRYCLPPAAAARD